MVPSGIDHANDESIIVRDVGRGQFVLDRHGSSGYDFFAPSPIYSKRAVRGHMKVAPDSDELSRKLRSGINHFMGQLAPESRQTFLVFLSAVGETLLDRDSGAKAGVKSASTRLESRFASAARLGPSATLARLARRKGSKDHWENLLRRIRRLAAVERSLNKSEQPDSVATSPDLPQAEKNR